jgi:hypothetical protein
MNSHPPAGRLEFPVSMIHTRSPATLMAKLTEIIPFLTTFAKNSAVLCVNLPGFLTGGQFLTRRGAKTRPKPDRFQTGKRGGAYQYGQNRTISHQKQGRWQKTFQYTVQK